MTERIKRLFAEMGRYDKTIGDYIDEIYNPKPGRPIKVSHAQLEALMSDKNHPWDAARTLRNYAEDMENRASAMRLLSDEIDGKLSSEADSCLKQIMISAYMNSYTNDLQ
ncbi:MAG: hypothetical protein AAF434_17380 [Pseudomonadota bacterium]